MTAESRPPPLRDIIARYGLKTRASLGQHFLLDYNLTSRIVRAAGPLAGVTVIEVGPGPGGLTRALLESDAAQIVAIERDRRCIPALEELAGEFPGRLKVVEGDALALEPGEIGQHPRKIVANLPYNISTKLLTNWLARLDALDGMTLMFQKEVARRLAAVSGSKDYGRLSVLGQWLCEIDLLFDISPRAFTPPPKVASTLVAFTPRPAPAFPASREALERITGAAFGQRRKMLRTSLKPVFADPAAAARAAGIDVTARAEDISVEGFCALARDLAKRSGPSRG
ncbi:MAG: 16S rRNA (adenine(1518)-N(6)/adenine(1519)-N(6))-dimethyltransferase RsmA [Alphaproteobacteria bacterium]|nr:16S rRNA (adenine(1518)-N(6)/adenine(1519)-N(6))-dimethyltransferase RsmA [Alphaproteobacteria bacterium]